MTVGARSLVIYVWDNRDSRIVELHRAVHAKSELSLDRRGFDGYFLLEEADALSARLKASYGNQRFAVRDWLARSPVDFYATRYGWTQAEFAGMFPDLTNNPDNTPSPAFFKTESRWSIWGVEIESWILGQKPGLPQDRDSFKATVKDEFKRVWVLQDADMRERGLDPANESQRLAYLQELRAQGKAAYTVLGDVCMSWTKTTFIDRAVAHEHLLSSVESAGDALTFIELPAKEVSLLSRLKPQVRSVAVVSSDSLVKHCRYRQRSDQGVLAEFIVGTHADNVIRALGRNNE